MLMPKQKKVLIVGSGGREHALGWKLGKSGRLYFAPGNAGTAEIGENIPIPAEDIAGLSELADKLRLDLTVVGPEAPLAMGIVDEFQARGLPIFGPTAAAAKLESSKAWAAGFMARHGIAHPRSWVFLDEQEAIRFVRRFPWGKMVVKADGLAAGKGVILPDGLEEAEAAVREMLSGRSFGGAGRTIVIQERLTGPELSVLAFCDGKSAVPLLPARDYKRIGDGDRGPNTGGMGAYAPVADIDIREIHRTILQPTVEGMRKEGYPYKGVLYAGLMLTAQGPKVLEYNARFGDPETQPLMLLLKSDLAPILLACMNGTLEPEMVRFRPGASVCVVLACAGYPGPCAKGVLIEGLDTVRDPNIRMFHAGTLLNDRGVVTSAGRVLGVTAYGETIEAAIRRAYGVIGSGGVRFEGMQYRRDIGGQAYGT